jgi:hypothetical protein
MNWQVFRTRNWTLGTTWARLFVPTNNYHPVEAAESDDQCTPKRRTCQNPFAPSWARPTLEANNEEGPRDQSGDCPSGTRCRSALHPASAAVPPQSKNRPHTVTASGQGSAMCLQCVPLSDAMSAAKAVRLLRCECDSMIPQTRLEFNTQLDEFGGCSATVPRTRGTSRNLRGTGDWTPHPAVVAPKGQSAGTQQSQHHCDAGSMAFASCGRTSRGRGTTSTLP